jgi:type IV pilus assembly protein PilQ
MKYKIISFFLIFSFHIAGIGQSNEIIKLKFEELSETVKGLNEKVELDVTKSTLQTFIAALGKSHNLNVSIDPSLNYPITANFSDELVKNVLIYLIEEYELETKFTGTIISFSKKNASYFRKNLQYNL